MAEENIFGLIRTVELFTNETIVRWSKSFRHNVGISSILVLSELKIKGAQKQTELAESLGYTPGAMTNVANKLIKDLFVKRQLDPSDRRIIRLVITKEGRELLAEAQQTGQALWKEIFSVLSADEMQQFRHINEKLLQNSKKN